MKIEISKPIKTAIKIILSVGILAFVFYKIDVQAVFKIFGRVNVFYFVLALLLFALSKLTAAFRLNRFLATAGITISHAFNIRLYLLGMFYNLFLPGGIGGDGYKIWLLNRRFEVKARSIFWSILLDRLLGLLALFCLAAGLAAFVPLPPLYKNWLWLLIPLALSAFYFFVRMAFKKYQHIFIPTLLQSFVVQILQAFSAGVLLLSIGISEQWTAYIFIFLLSSIVAAFPITIGGIGSREVTFLFGAQLMHLDVNHSIALSLLFYIITALVSLSGIYYSIRSDKLK